MQKINEMFNKSIQEKEVRTKKIINEMRNRYNEKNKSPEIKRQEEKVAENQRKSDYQVTSDYLQADGETFEE